MTIKTGNADLWVRLVLATAAASILIGGTVVRAASVAPACNLAPISDPYRDLAWTSLQFLPVDEQGVLFEHRGRRHFHPIATIQTALHEWAVGDQRIAQQLTDDLLAHSDQGWFPYGFGIFWTQSIEPPWYSALAQGQALSLLVRMNRIEEARAVYETFSSPRITWRHGGETWFLEYPVSPVNPVFNGHAFAIIGLIDYWRKTGEGDELACAGIRTLSAHEAEWIDASGVHWYDLRHWGTAGEPYPTIHAWQRETLFELTMDDGFMPYTVGP